MADRAWQDRPVTAWRFGLYEIDTQSGELRKAGRQVHLAGQPFKVLALLVARAGEVVTREELRRHLWGEGSWVEFDQGLNFSVRRIRMALGDDARSPRYLQTLPRRGYRFLVPAVLVAPPATTSRPVVPHAERRVRLVGSVAAVCCLLLLGQEGGHARAHTRRDATAASLAAFDEGLHAYEQGTTGRRRSIQLFRAATQRDPLFAEAYYAAADTYLGMAERGELPAGSALEQALRDAEAALALADDPSTRVVLARARYFTGDWTGAEADFEAALVQAPRSDTVLAGYARFLSAAGRHAEAIRAIDRAETLAPSCELIVQESGFVRYRARHFDEAVRKFARAAALGPMRGGDASEWRRYNRMRILFVHVLQDAWTEAGADAVAIAEDAGTPEDRLRDFAARPPRGRVERLLRTSLRMMGAAADTHAIPPTRFAEIYAALGDEESAFEWLERAARERHPALSYSLRDPQYDALRSRPRFQPLLDQVGSLPPPTTGRGPFVADASR